MYVAAVVIHAYGLPLDRPWSYLIPPALYRQGLEGCRVIVPFGRGNRRLVGMVLSVSETEEGDRKLKSVLSVADAASVLNEEQHRLMHWLRENTFCTYYDAIRTLVPLALQLRVEEHYRLREEADASGCSEAAQQLFTFLKKARTGRELDALLESDRTPEKQTALQELLDARAVELAAEGKTRLKGKMHRMVRLPAEPEHPLPSMTVKHQQVYDALLEFGTLEEKELCYICGVTDAVIKTMEKKHLIERYLAPVQEEAPAAGEAPPPLTLSEEQQKAYDAVLPYLDAGEAKCFLLRGVTGSGKTSVFEKLIEHTLSLGRSVLMLLPEIGLTPQVTARFTARFGSRIAVVHSGLSLSERKRSYERAKSGEADVIIGTRSAVFTPVPQLGLIIMDEEGERSYKSEAAPRYDTIQVARQRCKYHNAVLLAASATPTLESWHYAQKGTYTLLEMKQRYGNAPLPAVETIDMAGERMAGNDSEFSRTLHDALSENLEHGEQSILLLNRRGYHTIISCCTCNQPVYCENCSVPMTFHKTDGLLHCHYCGSFRELPQACPACGSEHLRRMGFGTQRLEDELAVRFPNARILRMDADTTARRRAYEEGFEAFRRGEYDIMLGTQMIGKGLDFPNVTLVGVLSVDKALFSGDFRSYERTFSLITQVVGRGGRGGKPGRAVLQTFLPDHYVLRLAAAQDFEEFARQELSVRKQLLFPPFCDICVIGVSGETLPEVQAGADRVIDCMRAELAEQTEKLPLRVLGPVPFTYHKLGGKYRYRIIVKCKNTAVFRRYLHGVLTRAAGVQELARVQLYADMNGTIGV